MFVNMASADLDGNGFPALSSQAVNQFGKAQTAPISGLKIGMIQTADYSIPKDRLSGLGYSITLISPDSGLTTFQQYDIVYLPEDWANEVIGDYDIIESHAPDYQAYIKAGGSLFSDQPNPYLQPASTVTPSLLPYPITFFYSYTLDDLPIIQNPNHEITQGLTDEEMPFPADQMLNIDSRYEVLVVGRKTGVASLVVGEYGSGRILVQTGHPSTDANHPFSDEVYIRMVNWVGTSSPDHLVISTISSPRALGVPFNVTIKAKDKNENTLTSTTGAFTLTCTSGGNSVSAADLKLVNGQWTGPVKVLDAGKSLQLKATRGGVSGISNPFDVTGSLQETGNISGYITNRYGDLVNGNVEVTLSGGAGTYTNTFLNGTYRFNGIPEGFYSLGAKHVDSGAESGSLGVYVRGCQCALLTIEFCFSTPRNKTPVLLVPGIMGSADKRNGMIYPVLPKDQGADGTKLKIHNPVLDRVGWKALEKGLDGVGYEKGCTYFEVPYDWRMDIHEIVKDYLIPAIDQAKQKTGKSKVNIIAHSMGGLVVRAYIQGDDHKYVERNDIDRFAMVGTPNEGSPIAYYMWEGGDPLLADDIRGPGIIWKNFYSNTTQENYKITRGHHVQALDHLSIWFYYTGTDEKSDPIKGLKCLLPTVPFLGSQDSKSLKWEKNGSLYELNEGKYKDNKNLMGKQDTSDEDKIKAIVFAGSQENTVKKINVGIANAKNLPVPYKDGHPIPYDHEEESAVSTASGDGTVLLDSALLPYNEGWASRKVGTGEHASLIKTFAEYLVNFVEGEIISEATKVPSTSKEAETSSGSWLAISLNGRVQGYLVDSSGRGSGVNPSTILMENDIPEGEIIFEGDAGSITVSNPADGSYTFYIKGIYNEDYNMDISYADGGTSVNLIFDGFNHSETQAFTLIVNSLSEARITLQHSPSPPSGLLANPEGTTPLQTRLTWNLSSDPTVIKYNVYSKQSHEPYLQFVGESVNPFFSTGDPWASDNTIPTRLYAVSSLKADGTESFLSGKVENNDRDHDGLTDAEENALGTNLSNPDSDGDGLKDGEEKAYGTKPLMKDTDGDTYNDYVEIQAGTDPLDSNSTPSTTLFVEPGGTCNGNSPCYSTIQAALNAATDGDLIKVSQDNYSEAPMWSFAGTVSISGGWNDDFSDQTGTTEMYAPSATGGGGVKVLPRVKVAPH